MITPFQKRQLIEQELSRRVAETKKQKWVDLNKALREASAADLESQLVAADNEYNTKVEQGVDAVASALSDIPYVIGGSIAGRFWGLTRTPGDIDVIIPANVDVPRLEERLRAQGITVDSLRLRDQPFAVATTFLDFLPIRFYFRTFALQDNFLSRRVTKNFNGTQIPVMTAEDVIIVKLILGSDKHHRDIINIVNARRDTLDTAYINNNTPQERQVDKDRLVN